MHNEVQESIFDEEVMKYGIRLDQRSKISLMTAMLYSTMESPNISEAVSEAIKIDREVGDQLRSLKHKRNQQQIKRG